MCPHRQEGRRARFVTAYDLIVLDGLLPSEDGLTLCGDLRRCGAVTPILMSTASAA